MPETPPATVPPRASSALAPGPDAERIGVLHLERDDDGIAVVTLDDPDHPANTLGAAYRSAMGTVLGRLEDERDSLAGVVVTSAKATFATGSDLRELAALTDGRTAFALARDTESQLRRLETLGVPVVAALGGAALGGGLEIALACHHRVAVDVPGSQFGLPEVTLGLMPAGGGVLRAVRLLGLLPALVNLLLRGQRYNPAQARTLGLLDELVATAEDLLPAAKAWIRAHPKASARWDSPGYQLPGGSPASPALAAALPTLPAGLRRELSGAPAPAARAILSAAVEGAGLDPAAAATVEARYFAELVTGQVAKNLLHAFYLDMRALGEARPAGIPALAPAKVAVLGAGATGAGLAYACAKAGLEVVLADDDTTTAEAGRAFAEKVVADGVRRGTTRRASGEALLGRITTATDLTQAGDVDVVAVTGDDEPGGHGARLETARRTAAPGALLAAVAAGPLAVLPETGNVVGLRFAGPADRAPLVEIVTGEKADDENLARALDLVAALHRTPLVTQGGASFLGRLLAALLAEAAVMIGEGVPAPSVEQAALTAGFPSPPLRLIDDLGLSAARSALGTPAVPGATAVLDTMVDTCERPGRAAGAGFYDYPDGHRGRLWAGLRERFAVPGAPDPAGLSLEDLRERLLFAVALAGVRCLDDEVVRSVPAANVGSLTGVGFPAWTGGVLGYANTYPGGLAGFVARAGALADAHGPRFAPPPSLAGRAARGEPYA